MRNCDTDRNVFKWIKQTGSDAGFEPEHEPAKATDAVAGSDEKLSILAKRVEKGLLLWHPKDQRSITDEADFDT